MLPVRDHTVVEDYSVEIDDEGEMDFEAGGAA